jgi:hypothetical protein
MSIYYQPTRRGSIEGAKTFVKNPKPPVTPAPKPARKPKPPKPKYSDTNTVTAVAFTIPMLIRLMELIHDEVRSEDELNVVVEKIINVGLNELLDLNSFAEIVNALGEYLVEADSEDYTTETTDE